MGLGWDYSPARIIVCGADEGNGERARDGLPQKEGRGTGTGRGTGRESNREAAAACCVARGLAGLGLVFPLCGRMWETTGMQAMPVHHRRKLNS